VNLDRMLYLVISQHRSGPLIHEVEVESMKRETVLEDLRHGQFGGVIAVAEINIEERLCREVTDEPEFREAIARDPDDR
jgi:hypothetical protein